MKPFKCGYLGQAIYMLPVWVVCGIISMNYYSFVAVFCFQRFDTQPVLASCLTFFITIITGLIFVSYYKCIFTSSAVSDNPPPTTISRVPPKCAKCGCLKPPRSHHCSQCGECILKMDHHCPWVANCVGLKNYKFFVLFLFYACIGCWTVCLGSIGHMSSLLTDKGYAASRFVALFSVMLALSFGICLLVFLALHAKLLMSGYTTLECGSSSCAARSPYSRGTLDNIRSVMGPSWKLWFIPIATPNYGPNGYDFAPCYDSDEESDTINMLDTSSTSAAVAARSANTLVSPLSDVSTNGRVSVACEQSGSCAVSDRDRCGSQSQRQEESDTRMRSMLAGAGVGVGIGGGSKLSVGVVDINGEHVAIEVGA